ncbi:MAG TPA: lysophospholipid acyltransferase family protein [Novosphingobium sp.]|nr:lysophospholipid acyltransferase family protein [Novosphingobium sp.]
MGERLRSLAFHAVFGGGTVLLALAIPVLMLMDRQAIVCLCTRWSNLQRWAVEHLLGIRVVIEGEVPQGACLVAMKHESMFEAVDLPTLLPFPAVFAKVELLRLPLWGKAGFRYGLVPVERDQGAKALRAMVAAARSLAETGRPLVIFPEGTRVSHGRQPAMQSGFAGLYKLIGLPVVPVAVDSGPLLHGFWKRRGTITYRFGAAIAPGLPRDAVEAQVHAAINALNAGA